MVLILFWEKSAILSIETTLSFLFFLQYYLIIFQLLLFYIKNNKSQSGKNS